MKKNVNQKVTCLCQWMENPVGIEARNPRFSWYLNHVSGIQAAYRLEVSADAGFSMLMWDSGIVKSDDSEAMYGGTPLESGCRYYYRVMVEKQGGGIYESDVSSFVTGLLETVDWDGAWIGGAGMRDHSLRFRCEFTLSEAVEEAAAFVASPNYYLLSCNGKRCGDMVLNNARTDYEKTLLYETWPLSLMKGKNTLGVELGNGWYCMELGARPVAKSEHLFAILVRIKYKSGRVEWRKSGHDDWYFTTKCPVTYNHIYDGEKYDARLEMPGWDKNDFCVQKEWRHAFEQDSPGGRICAQEMEPVRITGERKPKRITRLENGDFTVDFGQNFAGWIRIRLK